MSELSDNAKQLAETLCGSDYEMADGGIRGGIDHAADGHHFLHKYDTAALLEIASAALELSGEQIVDYNDYRCSSFWQRTYSVKILGQSRAVVRLLKPKDEPAIIDITDFTSLAHDAAGISLILLHAARTAREWASEGNNNKE